MSAAPPSAELSQAARVAQRLGVFGGSFDPVHAAHLWVAERARERFALEHIVWIPAARPPHKPGLELTAGAARAELLALATRAHPEWSVWTLELERPGPSYTVDTLRELVRLRGHERGLYLILGGDNLPGLPRWRAADELLRLAQPIVIARRDALRAALEALRGAVEPARFERLAAGFVDLPTFDLSATELRARLARGEDPGADLPPGVLAAIRAKGLYGTR